MAKICEARQYGDEMVCNRCKYAWDVNDPEPPECSTIEPPSRAEVAHNRGVAEVMRILES